MTKDFDLDLELGYDRAIAEGCGLHSYPIVSFHWEKGYATINYKHDTDTMHTFDEHHGIVYSISMDPGISAKDLQRTLDQNQDLVNDLYASFKTQWDGNNNTSDWDEEGSDNLNTLFHELNDLAEEYFIESAGDYYNGDYQDLIQDESLTSDSTRSDIEDAVDHHANSSNGIIIVTNDCIDDIQDVIDDNDGDDDDE